MSNTLTNILIKVPLKISFFKKKKNLYNFPFTSKQHYDNLAKIKGELLDKYSIFLNYFKLHRKVKLLQTKKCDFRKYFPGKY